MDLNIDNVFYKTKINWEEPVLYPGITPIKLSHIKEIEDALDIITIGLTKHALSNEVDKAHGRVTATNSGFMTKELYTRLIALKNDFINLYNKVIAVPLEGIITILDKAPQYISTGYIWCNGENSTPDTKGKIVLGAYSASPVDDYPDGKYTKTNSASSTDRVVTRNTVRATFQKRVQNV